MLYRSRAQTRMRARAASCFTPQLPRRPGGGRADRTGGQRLPRIARKLEEKVKIGNKIFVFKDPGDSGPAVARIVAALRSRADNTLLWVRKATPDHPAGLVVPACPGLILGFVPERPPREDPDIDCWAAVCSRALAYREQRQ